MDLEAAFAQNEKVKIPTIVGNIRQIVSQTDKWSPVQEFIELGLAPYFIEFISPKYDFQIATQKEALW
jgi:hypothetical protein